MNIKNMVNTKQTVKMLISPVEANYILANMNDSNRNIRSATVARYKNDMINGCWFENGQSQWIGFYEDGNLADGQHRLKALSESGISRYFNLEFGISKKAALGIDNHAARKMVDQIQIEGESVWMDKSIVAMCRMIMEIEYGIKQRMPTTSDVIRFAESHKEKLLHTRNIANSVKKNICSAYVKVAIFYAMHTESLSDIERFSKVLFSGIYDSKSDVVAVRLREKLLTSPELSRGSSARLIGVKIVMRAIKAFCEGQDLKKIYVPTSFCYSLNLEEK